MHEIVVSFKNYIDVLSGCPHWDKKNTELWELTNEEYMILWLHEELTSSPMNAFDAGIEMADDVK